MIALSSKSLQAVILCTGHTHDHIHFELNKVLQDFNKSQTFKLLPFSALLLMANQGGNQTPKVSSMLQKTAHVAHETKTNQKQNHGHFTQ